MTRSVHGATVGKQRRFDPAATAALLAVGIVAWTEVAWPWTARSLADALVNEWIIWFTALYLALIALLAVVQVGSRALTQLQLLRARVTTGAGGPPATLPGPQGNDSPFVDMCQRGPEAKPAKKRILLS
jgi:hypothetical protein